MSTTTTANEHTCPPPRQVQFPLPEATSKNNQGIGKILPFRPTGEAPAAVLDTVSLSIAGQPLIKSISATISAHGITAIMGPNGAGKSLLIKLLHGLSAPTGGTIFWDRAFNHGQDAGGQAMVFQRPVLLRRSVSANLRFAMAQRRRCRRWPFRADLALRADHARDREVIAALAEVGLEHLATRPARRLSGGEQQRLALARALITAPRILFLDEPSANLDPASTAIIERIVREREAAGMKIVIVTHDIAQARRLADEVILLHNGACVEQSCAPEFFDQPQSSAARAYLSGALLIGDAK